MESITKLRSERNRKCFKNFSTRSKRNLKRVIAKSLNNALIFEQTGMEETTVVEYFGKSGSFKKSSELHLYKSNILKHQNWTKNYMKIDFPKVISTDESRLMLYETDGWDL